MTTDVCLTNREQSFLDACLHVQGMGLFPSTINLIRHTDHRVKDGERITDLRNGMVARGLLEITAAPATRRPGPAPRTDEEVALVHRLALVEPQISIEEIFEQANAISGRKRNQAAIRAWVSKLRDEAAMPSTGVRADDEKAIRAKIDEETKERVEKDGRRIDRIEKRRNVLAQVDRLFPSKVSAAEASKAILEDFKARFSPKKPAADNRPTAFTQTAYTIHNVSRRMEHARHSTVSRRHAPYGMETAAG